jgi:hypothetical protein
LQVHQRITALLMGLQFEYAARLQVVWGMKPLAFAEIWQDQP